MVLVVLEERVCDEGRKHTYRGMVEESVLMVRREGVLMTLVVLEERVCDEGRKHTCKKSGERVC